MPARIVRLRTRADRLRAAEGAQLRQLVLGFAADRSMSERAVGEVVAAIDRETASRDGWAFVMVDPLVNASVVGWLIENSSRPMIAVRLWAELFPHIRNDTCEIVQTRGELAATLGVTPNHVSRVMTELESIGAISRARAVHGVAYFMNPLIGTHLSGALRSQLQALAVPLNFAAPGAKPGRVRKPERARKGPKLSVVPPVG